MRNERSRGKRDYPIASSIASRLNSRNDSLDTTESQSQKTHPRDTADARTRDHTPRSTRPVESSARESPNSSDRTHAHPDDEGVELLQTDDIILADGGTAWTDLTAFQRDSLEAVAHLEATDETCYGLEIKRHLETTYDEVNHGRLYPNLNDFADRDLLEKSVLDCRTNEYLLTDAGHTLLENKARALADTFGLPVHQPATDGGER